MRQWLAERRAHDMTIFKYLTLEEHARGFMDKGIILLRPLSYYRALEDRGVRGDAADGMLSYAPKPGLEITKEDGTVMTLPDWRFTSSVQDDDVFAFCASRSLSFDLAERFEASVCVEITDEEALAARLRARAHPTSRLDYASLAVGFVDYRGRDVEPSVTWALPEQLAFIKPETFAWQEEYRIAIPKRGAFGAENVECALTRIGTTASVKQRTNPGFTFKIGALTGLCRLHRF